MDAVAALSDKFFADFFYSERNFIYYGMQER